MVIQHRRKKLVGFEKVALKAGESANVDIHVDASALEVWDVNAGEYVVEDGTYQLYAAHSSDLKGENVLNKKVKVSGSTLSNADTAEKLNVWSSSFTASDVKYVEYSKGNTAEAAAADSDEIFAVMAKKPGAYTALLNVDLDQVKQAVLNVASTEAQNGIELRLDAPDGKLIGSVNYGATEAVTSARTSENGVDAGTYTELGYTTASTDLSGASGVHNVYLVFKNANARVEGIQFVTSGVTIPDGLANEADENGNWNYYIDGKVATDATGLAPNAYGWWYVKNGKVDFTYTGLVSNDQGWFMVVNGMVDFGYTGLVANEYGWWMVQNGSINFAYTGLAANEYGWWYVQNGSINFSYNGLAANENGWFMVQGGKVDFNYTGLVTNEYGWWYVQNGSINFNYTGLAANEYGWWYVNGGKIDFGYTGRAANEYGWWNVVNGKVVF
ncbi:MAG: fibronectin type III-like domain-contianing protein [Eubacterium ramulus]